MLRHKHFIIFMYLGPVLETNLFQIPPDRKQRLSRLNAENELHTLVYCIPPNPMLS
jgi:hypothetical protein